MLDDARTRLTGGETEAAVRADDTASVEALLVAAAARSATTLPASSRTTSVTLKSWGVLPPEQVHELWRVLARALDARLGTSPLWLSTAGLGGHWLHVRIDPGPKYYRPRACAKTAGSEG